MSNLLAMALRGDGISTSIRSAAIACRASPAQSTCAVGPQVPAMET